MTLTVPEDTVARPSIDRAAPKDCGIRAPLACPLRRALCLLLVFGVACAAGTPVFCLAETGPNGLPRRPLRLSDPAKWDIVIPREAHPAERTAALEFQRLFALASGHVLPISAAGGSAPRHVYVGLSEALETRFPGFPPPGLGPEDFRLLAEEGLLAIAGGRPRGTLYGVFVFFEDYLGVRFLTADHTHVPPLDREEAIGPVDRVVRPTFAYRFCSYAENGLSPDLSVHLRYNARKGTTPEWGGATDIPLVGHSLGSMLPAGTWGASHPEYFAEYFGERRCAVTDEMGGEGTQPCLTHPDVVRLVTENVLQRLDQDPALRVVPVSQNDNWHYCRCPRCRALTEAEGSPMAPLLTLVNAAADAAAEKHPGAEVGTLAYMWSRKPPKTLRPRPNVRLQLCTIECCQVHALGDPACPVNRAFAEDLDRWRAVTGNLWAWTYAVNFTNYFVPCPNLRRIGENLRFLAGKGVRGIFVNALGGTPAGEFSDLRNFLAGRLLWDPALDGRALADEFLSLHYGKAAPPLRRFIDRWLDRLEASGLHPPFYGNAAEFGWDEALLEDGFRAFREAMESAGSDVIRRRVEKASLFLYRLRIDPVWNLTAAERRLLPPEWLRDLRKPADTFFRLCRKHGVRRVSDGMTLDEACRKARGVFGVKPGTLFGGARR